MGKLGKHLLAAGALALLVSTTLPQMASATEGDPAADGKATMTFDFIVDEEVVLDGSYDPSRSIFPTAGPVIMKPSISLLTDDPEQAAALAGKTQGTATWKIYESPKLEVDFPGKGDGLMNTYDLPAGAVLFDSGTMELKTGETVIASAKTPVIDPAEVEEVADIKIQNFSDPLWQSLRKKYYLTVEYAGNDDIEPITGEKYQAVSSLYLHGSAGAEGETEIGCLRTGEMPHPRVAGQEIKYCADPSPVKAPIVEDEQDPVKKTQPLIDTGASKDESPSVVLLGAGSTGIVGAIFLSVLTRRLRRNRN